MTQQEAINLLEKMKDGSLEHAKNFEGLFHQKSIARREVEAFTIAINAINRITPKKPKHEATIRSACTCPRCGNVVDEFTEFRGQRVRVTEPYCKYCGQALDWSDGDE